MSLEPPTSKSLSVDVSGRTSSVRQDGAKLETQGVPSIRVGKSSGAMRNASIKKTAST